MSRTIDADALLAELSNTRFPGAPYVDAGISIAIGKVCDAPTIEERKTGQWIEDDDEMSVICSECGESNDRISNFCPNCGSYNGGEQKEGAQDG